MTRRIDHLVLAVHDLEAAAEFYRRLGFQVGARNRHSWGTENHVIQFASSFLELITVGEDGQIPPHTPHAFSFGAFVRDYLARREGLAMFVLDSGDARADAADYARQGIGDFAPFSFERVGRAADGTETHVAFTLAFAMDERLPDASFFVCEQHYPEAFWSPQLQQHDNRATNVVAVTLDAEQPAEHTEFLQGFTGVGPADDGSTYLLAEGGRLQLETSAAGRFTGFSVGVSDLHRVATILTAEGVPFQELSDRVVVDSDQAFGARIEFRTGRAQYEAAAP